MVVLLLVQGVQTAAHWYHDATSQVSSVTATQASPETASLSRFEYVYQPDRLSSAAPQARNAYDPYGRAAANMQSSFQYANSSFYTHAPSAVSVTPMRAYAPSTGRWVERDPLPAK